MDGNDITRWAPRSRRLRVAQQKQQWLPGIASGAVMPTTLCDARILSIFKGAAEIRHR